MSCKQPDGANAQGLAVPDATTLTPSKDDGPRLMADGVRAQGRTGKPDAGTEASAWRAMDESESENKAAGCLAQLQVRQADPEVLAVMVSMLYGAALLGFCRAIGKALGVRHG